MRLDNPLLVRWEFASEERLAKRNEISRRLARGEHPEESAFRAVAEVRPRRVLDVGCGTGELAVRIKQELGAEVVAVDISPRMVELTKEQGVEALVADVEELPFEDASFDCVSACWVLYHAPDVHRAIAECERVLRPGGRLVATTVGDNLPELWSLVGSPERELLSFNAVDGDAQLRRRFPLVERRDVVGELVFPDPETMRMFVASTIAQAHLAPAVPDFEGDFHATTRHTVFVAEKGSG
jgi:SAM-dependent methyltransferase